ncbi:MAG: zinc ribbon domain-containing protein [Planctomycetota bacterium]|nr:MAG: zinc ribbon domain-containing protein [Planctomycetota bacterium]
MPIYEYQCHQCRCVFEVLVRSSEDESEVVCPDCKSREADRRLSVFAAQQGKTSATEVPPIQSPCGQCSAPDGTCPYRP